MRSVPRRLAGAALPHRVRPWEGEAPVRERIDQAVGHQAVERTGALGVIRPGEVETGERHRVPRVPQDGEQAAAALPVGALVALPAGSA